MPLGFDTNSNIDGNSGGGGGGEVTLPINATDVRPGTVSNTEFGYLEGVTSNIQEQLNSRVSMSGAGSAGRFPVFSASGVISSSQFQVTNYDNVSEHFIYPSSTYPGGGSPSGSSLGLFGTGANVGYILLRSGRTGTPNTSFLEASGNGGLTIRTIDSANAPISILAMSGGSVQLGSGVVASTRVSNSGLAIGTGANPTIPLAVRNTSGVQQRWEYSATVVATRHVNSSGFLTDSFTGNNYALVPSMGSPGPMLTMQFESWGSLASLSSRDLTQCSLRFTNVAMTNIIEVGASPDFIGLDVNLSPGSLSSGGGFKSFMWYLDEDLKPLLAFYGTAPAPQPEVLGELTDGSGGTASLLIDTIADPATADAIASLVAQINDLKAGLGQDSINLIKIDPS